jgi:hypothetical protein
MVICPSCGAPRDDDAIITSEDEEVSCRFCGWKGARRELLLLASNDLAQHPQILDRLTVLMEFMARSIGPQVGIKLIKLGLVSAEVEFAPLLAGLTRDSMNAAYKSLLLGLFPTEEDDAEAR